jgi:hypothetical protein
MEETIFNVFDAFNIFNIYKFTQLCEYVYENHIIKTYPHIEHPVFIESILSWTMFAGLIPYTFIIASRNHMYDFIGAAVVAIASYRYHSRKRDAFINGEIIDLATEPTKSIFLTDQLSLHLKSWLFLLAIMPFNSMSVPFSLWLHSACFSASVLYLEQNEITEIIDAFVIVPGIYDLYQTKVNATILITLTFIFILKPFRKANHIAIHILCVALFWIMAFAII